jgi:hypothetical protein
MGLDGGRAKNAVLFFLKFFLHILQKQRNLYFGRNPRASAGVFRRL